MKRLLLSAVGALGAAILLAGSPSADSAVTFPVLLEGEDCVFVAGAGQQCYDTTWTLEGPGVFSESWGLTGTWGYNMAASTLVMQYVPGMGWDYEYRGVRTGTCFDGAVFDLTGAQKGAWNACLVT